MSLTDFLIYYTIGKGAFGKVYLAQLPDDDQLYAIKVIRKDKILKKKLVSSTELERDILLEADHPFLCGMKYLFQSAVRLYFVMYFIGGDELSNLVKNKGGRMIEADVKFYITQIVVGLGILHKKGIVHRDIKLENIMVDCNGYVKIIDFGLAKKLTENTEAKTLCGTVEYFAPEMIGREGYDRSVDWWAVGIMIYKMLFGRSPFFNKNRQIMEGAIRVKEVKFPNKEKYNIDYSDEVVDLIKKLLIKDKDQRLGSQGDANEILDHPWFADIDIGALERFEIEAP